MKLRMKTSRRTSKQMSENQRDDPCARCGTDKGCIPISDDEDKSYWICEKCDDWLFS